MEGPRLQGRNGGSIMPWGRASWVRLVSVAVFLIALALLLGWEGTLLRAKHDGGKLTARACPHIGS